jgi:hypothetical protein
MGYSILKRLIPLSMMLILGRCDLPIHCLKSQILGTWEFNMTELSGSSDEK